MKILLIFFALVCQVNAKIEWHFETVSGYTIVFNATIGTPGQKVQLTLEPNSFWPELRVPSTNIQEGIFNPNTSSTFVKTGDALDYQNNTEGIIGTDTFVIGNGIVEKSEPFTVLDTNWYYDGLGSIGIGRPTDGSTSFIQAVLKDQEKNVLVLTYDHVFGVNSNYSSGSFTLGGIPDNCGEFTLVPEAMSSIRPYDQWAVALDQITAGKYVFATPGEAIISTESFISFPQTTFYNILTGLGSQDGNSLPCDTTVELIFTVGGFELKLQPEDYIAYDDSSNECVFYGFESFGSDNYEIPASLLRNKCLLLDYENIQIGFAEKTQ